MMIPQRGDSVLGAGNRASRPLAIPRTDTMAEKGHETRTRLYREFPRP